MSVSCSILNPAKAPAVMLGSFCRGTAVMVLAAAVGLGIFGQQLTPLMLRRGSAASCLPEGWSRDGPEALQLEGQALGDFGRDGAIIIRGGLSPEWVARMRETVEDSFAHPTFWDKLYTTGLASFFCAQKTVLLPQTSRCGQNMVRFSPLARYASQLLQSQTIRVAEPSEGMGSFVAEHGRRRPKDGAGHENCGHTAFHRDDSYFPIRADPATTGPAVVRFWIPLDDMPAGTHTMTFVAGSHLTRGTDNLSSTHFGTTAQQDNSKLPLIHWHAKPGDVIAFAGGTVHNAATRNCSSCMRLILGFAGDNAIFDATVPSPLMPLSSGQSHGAPLHGPPFPLVLDNREGGSHYHEADWEPLAPSVLEVASVTIDSFSQGIKGFSGTWFSGCTRSFGKQTAPFRPCAAMRSTCVHVLIARLFSCSSGAFHRASNLWRKASVA